MGARNCVGAGQAALRYALMRPFERPLRTASRTHEGDPVVSTANGGHITQQREEPVKDATHEVPGWSAKPLVSAHDRIMGAHRRRVLA